MQRPRSVALAAKPVPLASRPTGKLKSYAKRPTLDRKRSLTARPKLLNQVKARESATLTGTNCGHRFDSIYSAVLTLRVPAKGYRCSVGLS